MPPSRILGPDGQPLDRAVLTEEQAVCTVTGVRQTLSGHPSIGLEPRRLGQLLRDAEYGDALAYLELAEDMEEKDLHYRAVLGTRKLTVSQLPVEVDAASDAPDDVADADLVREALARIDIADLCFDLLDGLGKGYAVAEIQWDLTETAFFPRCVQWVDPRWFQIDRINGRTIRLKDGTLEGADLPHYKYVVHRPKTKTGLPIRGGLARAVAWAFLFKMFGVKGWIQFADGYGQPIRIGKYGPGASGSDKETLLRAVRNLAGDMAAIIPDSMTLELTTAPGGTASADLHQKLAGWFDRQVSKAVLGQTTTTDAISGGHAVSQEHRQVQEDIERADARQLAATLTRDLVIPLVRLNRGERMAWPSIRIGRPDEVDLQKMVTALAALVPLGLKVGMSTVRDRLGFPDPEPDEEVLTSSGVPAAPPSATPNAPASRTGLLDAGQSDRDLIDITVDSMLADAGPVTQPMVDAILAAANHATSFADFQQALAEMAGRSELSGLVERLDRAGFAARVAGRLGMASA